MISNVAQCNDGNHKADDEWNYASKDDVDGVYSISETQELHCTEVGEAGNVVNVHNVIDGWYEHVEGEEDGQSPPHSNTDEQQ